MKLLSKRSVTTKTSDTYVNNENETITPRSTSTPNRCSQSPINLNNEVFTDETSPIISKKQEHLDVSKSKSEDIDVNNTDITFQRIEELKEMMENCPDSNRICKGACKSTQRSGINGTTSGTII